MEQASESVASISVEQELSNDETASSNLDHMKIDLENWMGQLPEYLTNTPLIYLAIPGSHNSFSYSLSPSCKISPDSPPIVHTLEKWFKSSKYIVFNWSQGQKEDVTWQLKAGIRYLDIRLVVYKNEILICHGLNGGHIKGFLEDIHSYLESHKKEVVILDFQHFYEFKPEHHDKMISMLKQIFRNLICCRQRRMKENTLCKLWECHNQVLIIYRHQVTRFNDIFWPSGTWSSPWPDKIKVRELIEFLNKGLSNRKDGMGHVSQGILTPTPKYVALHLFGSLKSLASHTNKKLISWLESKHIGDHGINVVICDFVESYNFCEKVVLLNYKNCDLQKQFNIIDKVNCF